MIDRDDIIRMAHEAGLHIATDVNWMPIIGLEYAKKFAELVAAAERNRTWTQDHWTEYERSIAAAEREACAKLMGELTCMGNAKECFEVAATYIRARGQG